MGSPPDDDNAPLPPRPATAPTLVREPDALPARWAGAATYDPLADSLPGSPSTTPTDGGPTVVAEAPGRYDAVDASELGRGGIGRVLLVHDTHLGRDVAVKELLGGGAAVGRFLREARVTAQLEHPNIVPVYELGRREDGTLYYTMKHVRGRTLADALASCSTMDERLGLLGHFVSTGHAVAYAHSRGVVHRDIKPSNIMVGEFGETVLLDWGLAKVRGQHDLRGGDLERELLQLRTGDASATLQGSMMGTPAYMSPEQAEGRIDDIDTRSDVWSLGAVLFEILTGVPPFVGRTPMETLLKVIHEPSPQADEAPVDLANVCAKALKRDPALRYPSAAELAEEIVQWQAGRTVRAYPYTPLEIARKFLARNRSLVLALFVAVSVISAVSGLWTQRLRGEQVAALDVASTATGELGAALAALADEALADGDPARAWVYAAGSLARGESPAARGALSAAAAGWLPERGWELALGEAASSARISPDGSSVAIGGRTGTWLRVQDAQQIRKVEVPGDSTPVVGFLAPADLVTARAGGSILVWRDREVVRRIPTAGPIRALTTEGSAGVIIGTQGGAVERWDTQRRVRLGRLEAGGAVTSVAGTANRSAVAATVRDGASLAWIPATGKTHRLPPGAAVALSSDGSQLALALRAPAGRVEVWEVEAGTRRFSLDAHSGAANAVAFSHDGRHLATGGEDGRVRVWEADTGRPVGRFDLGAGAVAAIDLDREGKSLVAATRDGRALQWRGALPAPRRVEAPPASALRFGADGRLRTEADLVEAAGLGVRLAADRIEYIDALGNVVLESEVLPAAPLYATHRGSNTAVALVDGRIVSLDGAKVLGSSPPTGAPMGKPVISVDGTRVYAAEPSGAVCGWSVGSMTLQTRMVGLPEGEVAVALSPDSALVGGGGQDGIVALWAVATGALRARFRAHPLPVVAIALGPDHTLATAGSDGELGSWSTASLDWTGEAALAEAETRFGLRLSGGKIETVERR